MDSPGRTRNRSCVACCCMHAVWRRLTTESTKGDILDQDGNRGAPGCPIPEAQPSSIARCVLCTNSHSRGCHEKAVVLLVLGGLLIGFRSVSAAESSTAGLAASKAKDLFPTTNDTLFVEDLESSRIARTFAENVALPIKSMVPRSYSATFVRAQMSVRV